MDQKIFSDCRLFIIPNGLLKKRIELFEKQILKYGGNIISDINDSSITHIIIEDNYLLNPYRVKNALNSVKLLREDTNYVIVGTLWLSKCLKEKKLLSTEEFLFNKKRKLTNELCEKFDEPQVKIKIIKVHKIVSYLVYSFILIFNMMKYFCFLDLNHTFFKFVCLFF